MSNLSTESLNSGHMTKHSISAEKINKALKAPEKPVTYVSRTQTPLSHLKSNENSLWFFQHFNKRLDQMTLK